MLVMPGTIEADEPKISSIKITQRTNRTWQTYCLHHILSPFSQMLGRPKKKYPAGSPHISVPSHTSKECNVNERKVEDIWIYDISLKTRPPHTESPSQHVHRIYYFAGGGWQSPPSPSHWKFFSCMLREMPHSTFSLVSYPLAPNSPAPKAFPMLLKMYNTLLQEAARDEEFVTIMGDSAGGNIALCLPLEALRTNPDGPKPQSIMAICPSADMCREDPHLKDVEKHDPILNIKFINFTAEGWCGEWDKTDPRVSPIRSEHLDLFRKAGVKVDGVTAGWDLLGLDGRNFRDKIAAEGVEGEWLDWDKQMHCFVLTNVYRMFPESVEAAKWVVDVLKKRLMETGPVVEVAPKI